MDQESPRCRSSKILLTLKTLQISSRVLDRVSGKTPSVIVGSSSGPYPVHFVGPVPQSQDRDGAESEYWNPCSNLE